MENKEKFVSRRAAREARRPHFKPLDLSIKYYFRLATSNSRLGLTPLLAMLAMLGQIDDMGAAQAKPFDDLMAAPLPNSTSVAPPNKKPVELVIDTDGGVDDAAAIVWLLSQTEYPVDILGFGTVAGNTTVENAANNVLTLLDTLGQPDIPIAIGAAAPLSEQLSRTGSLLHGPDGLWGVQKPQDLSGLSRDVPSFYRDLAQANPGATLLSLGPLTNLAQAWQQYPDALGSFQQIIALGGANNGGNITPVAESNIWQDPQAANELLTAGLPTTLVPLDAFAEFTLTTSALQALPTQGSEAAKVIAEPLSMYAAVQTETSGTTDVLLPDVTAAMYAVDSSLGTAESALVKVVTQPSLARGETVIGLTMNERVSIIAEDAELSQLAQQVFSDPTFDLSSALNAILAREPDNALLVTDIAAPQMRELFLSALAPSQKPISVPEPSCVLGLLAFSAFGAAGLLKRKGRGGDGGGGELTPLFSPCPLVPSPLTLVERLEQGTRRGQGACPTPASDLAPKRRDVRVPPRRGRFYLAARLSGGSHSRRVSSAICARSDYSQVVVSSSTESPQITKVEGGREQPAVYRS